MVSHVCPGRGLRTVTIYHGRNRFPITDVFTEEEYQEMKCEENIDEFRRYQNYVRKLKGYMRSRARDFPDEREMAELERRFVGARQKVERYRGIIAGDREEGERGHNWDGYRETHGRGDRDQEESQAKLRKYQGYVDEYEADIRQARRDGLDEDDILRLEYERNMCQRKVEKYQGRLGDTGGGGERSEDRRRQRGTRTESSDREQSGREHSGGEGPGHVFGQESDSDAESESEPDSV